MLTKSVKRWELNKKRKNTCTKTEGDKQGPWLILILSQWLSMTDSRLLRDLVRQYFNNNLRQNTQTFKP